MNKHAFGWFDRYLIHKSSYWAAFAIYQVHRYNSITMTISSHKSNCFWCIRAVFNLFSMLLYDLLCLVLFSMHMVDSTCIWSIQPIYDIVDFFCLVKPVLDECNLDSNNTWSLQPLLKVFSSIFMYSIDSICLWFILTVYDIFYLYLVDLPGVCHFQSLFNHFILHFGQLNMCMTKTTCIWSILTVFDLFDLYMTTSPGSWLI